MVESEVIVEVAVEVTGTLVVTVWMEVSVPVVLVVGEVIVIVVL